MWSSWINISISILSHLVRWHLHYSSGSFKFFIFPVFMSGSSVLCLTLSLVLLVFQLNCCNMFVIILVWFNKLAFSLHWERTVFGLDCVLLTSYFREDADAVSHFSVWFCFGTALGILLFPSSFHLSTLIFMCFYIVRFFSMNDISDLNEYFSSYLSIISH